MIEGSDINQLKQNLAGDMEQKCNLRHEVELCNQYIHELRHELRFRMEGVVKMLEFRAGEQQLDIEHLKQVIDMMEIKKRKHRQKEEEKDEKKAEKEEKEEKKKKRRRKRKRKIKMIMRKS